MKRDQIWQIEVVSRSWTQAKIRQLCDRDFHSRLHALFGYRARPASLQELEEILDMINYIDTRALVSEIEQGIEVVLGSLRRRSINPMTSRVKVVHSYLHDAAANSYDRHGQRTLAIWHRQLAAKVVKAHSPLARGQQHLPIRFEATNRECLHENLQIPLPSSHESDLDVAIALRRQGDPLGALLVLGRGDDVRDQDTYLWEEAFCRAQLSFDLSALVGMARKRPYAQQLEAAIWALIVPSTEWIGRISLKKNRDGHALYNLFQVLSDCYRKRAAASVYVTAIGRALAKTEDLDAYSQLLAFGAVLRFTIRRKQNELLTVVEAQYRHFSLEATQGASEDIFLVFDAQRDIVAAGRKSGVHPVPLGVTRAGKGLTLTYKLAKELGTQKMRRLFSDRTSSTLRPTEAQSIIKVASTELGLMRGPLMKMGQIFANQNGLDSEVLYAGAYGITGTQVKAVLNLAYDGSFDKRFRSFNAVPAACGSIGQVHTAELWDGRKVAVKIQYPNIKDAINWDLKQVIRLTPLLKLMSPETNFKEVWQELRRHLLLECDFINEARHQQDFHDLWKNDPDIFVPAPVRDLCRQTVLVSDWVDGKSFAQFAESESKEKHETAAKAIVRFVVSSCRDGYFNTDPHPGNYLFVDDRVAFLDFGSIKRWSSDQQNAWRDLIWSAIDFDFDRFFVAVTTMEMFGAIRKESLRRVFEKLIADSDGMWMGRGQRQLEQEAIARHLNKSFLGSKRRKNKTRLPWPYIFGFRVYFGHIATISRLHAKVDWNAFVRDIMANPPVSTK